MTVELNGTILLLAIPVLACLFVAAATAPRWCTRSMSKHALWRLRDDVVGDTIAGRLPPDHDAVRELIARVEWSIRETRSFDILHLALWLRATRCLPEDTRRAITRLVTLAGLSSEETTRIEAYRGRYNTVAISAIFLTSWIGMALLVPSAIAAVFRAVRRRMEHSGVRHALSQISVGLAAQDTTLGRQARDFVTANGPSSAHIC